MTTSKIAVIDIGSNSVRLVVYDGLKRTPLPLVNEKVLCGLARDMEQTSCLHVEGTKEALLALGRFSELIKIMKIKDVSIIATSAVRDAKDGKAFIKKVKDNFGLIIKIIDGNKESELAALGVISSMDGVDGVIGDYGGGSLEFASINDEKKIFHDAISNKVSLPIGALRLRTLSDCDKKKAKEIAEKYLKKYNLEKKLKGKNFYAVGGGFRALAKYHIDRTGYPLSVLHQYKVDAKKMLQTAKRVAAMESKKIMQLPYFPESRSDTMSYTAIVLEKIIELGKPNQIIFSAQGVREGMLADNMSDELKRQDALLESCIEIIRHISPEKDSGWVKFGQELFKWMTPLFRTETEEIKRLREVACILTRLAWHEHTAYQAEMAFRWVLDSAIPAIDHKGRVFVATSVFHRYQTDANKKVMEDSQSLLDKEMIFRAQVIGNAMRLGYAISGGANGVLQKTPLTLTDNNNLILSAKEKKDRILFGDLVEKRFDKLGKITGLNMVVEK
jgi:exopolyphosphatase/guanosine-5'-triphosphate,3'-diphosphate pyrophosphatase